MVVHVSFCFDRKFRKGGGKSHHEKIMARNRREKIPIEKAKNFVKRKQFALSNRKY